MSWGPSPNSQADSWEGYKIMPANSPYFTGAAPNFGPPAGLAGLISQGRDHRVDTSGFQQFADVAEKFKRQQDMGKAADFFVKANPEALAQMGVHQDQWKTFGARDKSSAITGFMKAQATQQVMQEFAEVARQTKAREKFQTFAQGNPKASSEELLRAGVGAGMPMEDLARISQAFHYAQDASAVGDPKILEGPFAGTKIVTDARGRGTPQVITDPEQRRTQFTVEPLINPRSGEIGGYGVKATFGSEEEARSWAQKQNKATGSDATYDAELKFAREALASGVAREKVAAKFKARTGKDLPQ